MIQLLCSFNSKADGNIGLAADGPCADPQRGKLQRYAVFLCSLTGSARCKTEGDEKTVVRQVPEAGQSIPAGGTVLLYADCLARVLYSAELPISILTTLVGVPFLVYFMCNRKRGRI